MEPNTDDMESNSVKFIIEQNMEWIQYISAAIILVSAISVRFNLIDIPIFLIITSVIISLNLGMKVYTGKRGVEANTPNNTDNNSYQNVIPKIMLLVGYHTLLLTVVYFTTINFLKPMVDFQWHGLVEWLRKTLIAVYYAGTVALTVRSILSCWDSEALAEDQTGQLSIGGWMPSFGKNMTNGPFGVFTGLPSTFVRILSFSAKAPKIVWPSSIQIPIHNDSEGKLFQTEFLWSAKVRIADTRLYTLNTIRESSVFKECEGIVKMDDVKKDWDIVNIVERNLTAWSNNQDLGFNNIRNLEFTTIADVKPHQKNIETMLNDLASKQLMESHGIQLTEFFLESIEIPKAQIQQQIDDAKSKAATIAAEEREDLDNKSLIRQAKELQDASRGDDGKVTLDFQKALQLAQIQQGKIRASTTNITGSGGKGKKGGL